MPTYYQTKQEALDALARIAGDERIQSSTVSLEPYNGWVAAVTPRRIDCPDLVEAGFEVRDGIARPVEKKAPARIAPAPKAPGSTSTSTSPVASAPSKGATARVWEIADRVTGEKGQIDRKAIMAACEEAGINLATAGTQFSKWKKARG